jgi:hypothetical protein
MKLQASSILARRIGAVALAGIAARAQPVITLRHLHRVEQT